MKVAKRKRSTSKSSSAAKGGKSAASGESKAAVVKAKRQTASVLIFGAAILILCMVLIPGGSFWAFMHNLLLGSFGICAYILPFLMMYIAIIIALEKSVGSISAKLWQSMLLITMLGSAFQIFLSDAKASYFSEITAGFVNGKVNKGGGVVGVILGYPLEKLFTDVPAKITIILLIVIFLMLVTGTTLIALFRAAVSPVKKAKQSIENAMIAKEEKKNDLIDIDIGEGYIEMPDHPVKSEKFKALEKATIDLNDDFEQPLPESIELIVDEPSDQPPPAYEKPAKLAMEIKQQTGTATLQRDENYHYPPLSLLDDSHSVDDSAAAHEQKVTAELLVKTLNDFGISTRIVNISRGPTVTRYELEPSAGVKISRITGLSDDIALRLATSGVRIEAPIPNKAAVGIEVPTRVSSGVCLRELIDTKEFSSSKSPLTVALGKDISGNLVITDLSRMPHLLIAGTTGSGKSVCTNAMIQSVLYKSSPNDVRMLLIDPKQVEFNIYNGIPHLLVPVVTDPRKAAGALGWAVTEMLNRYKLFAENNVRDLKSYNELAKRNDNLHTMPLILIVIDELSDLMMAAANEVEDAIIRIAQMARAAGMHLVIATQRPSVDVITGLIKANIPSRLALTVASAVDSRTIIDSGGAEKLLGRGDMLFMPVGVSKPVRVQGCFVSNREVESVVHYLKDSEDHEYDDEVIEEIERQAAATGKSSSKAGGNGMDGDDESDEMLPQAIEAVIENGAASTSLLQRRLRLGYARAGRLIDEMEQRGIIGPYEGSKPRQVLITRQQWLEMNINRSEE
ncbi:MAG: DNA translocase FtsK 4TM domain-containing protein [Oscillospiraceae bacterium]|nr:DNA translocase FtsK 4TM domain-containing protein [Oscillospiraceae bacterium]